MLVELPPPPPLEEEEEEEEEEEGEEGVGEDVFSCTTTASRKNTTHPACQTFAVGCSCTVPLGRYTRDLPEQGRSLSSHAA